MDEFGLDYSELQKTIEQLLPEKFPISFEQLIEHLKTGEVQGFAQMGKEIWDWLLQSITFPIEQGMRLLVIILFSTLLSKLNNVFPEVIFVYNLGAFSLPTNSLISPTTN